MWNLSLGVRQQGCTRLGALSCHIPPAAHHLLPLCPNKQVLEVSGTSLHDPAPWGGSGAQAAGLDLLTPTIIYVPRVLALHEKVCGPHCGPSLRACHCLRQRCHMRVGRGAV